MITRREFVGHMSKGAAAVVVFGSLELEGCASAATGHRKLGTRGYRRPMKSIEAVSSQRIPRSLGWCSPTSAT